MLKYFVWISEVLKNLESFYDYEDKIRKKSIANPDFIITDRADKLFSSTKLLMEYILKEQVNIYLNILRTSLSIGGTGFTDLLTSRFDINYPSMGGMTPQQEQLKPGGLFGMRKKKE